MRVFGCILVAIGVPVFCCGQAPVLTGGYDLARTNSDIHETILTPASVNPAGFGRLFTLPADGQIWAQPLYLPNVSLPGGTHNVVYMATAHNTVYAYDADTAGPPLWSVNLGPAVPSSVFDTEGRTYTDITPEIGILGTPVIDASTGTLYVVAATLENGVYYHRLHALDVASGAEKFNAPVAIQATVSGIGNDSIDGRVGFNSALHMQRPALLLLNGVVYAAFGSHGDSGIWHGWIMGYNASNVQLQTAVFNSTPNGYGGSIWNSGRGLSADAQNNIYAVASNGTSDGKTEFSNNVLRLTAGTLAVTDWFAPSNVRALDDDDDDLGASGAVLLPGNYLLTGGKQGIAYLLNSGSLGHIGAHNTQIPQSFPAADVGIYNMAVWDRSDGPVLYLAGGNAPVAAYPFSANQFATTPSSTTAAGFGVAFNGMTVSANAGTAGSGILWMITADSWPLPATGTLYAFNADNLGAELWNSSINIGRDALGQFTKFANPTVANGKVYAPTSSGALAVYGELPASATNTPVITGVVNAASYAGGSVAPGEIVDIFGRNLGPQGLATGTLDANGNLGTNVAGTQVVFNGVAAPLLYASEFVVSAVVPFQMSGAASVSVAVTAGGANSAAQTFSAAPTAPGIFTDDSSGNGQAAVLNADYSVNSDDNPAVPGAVVILYATGGGEFNEDSGQLLASATATVGGQPAAILFAGQAGGEIAGAVQVNLQLPEGITGDLPVVLTLGGVPSQSTASIAVQP